MAYQDINEVKEEISRQAEIKLTYRSNEVHNDSLTALLYSFCGDGIDIIKKWRKLITDEEFLAGKWDYELKDFVCNSYNQLNEETVSEISNNIGKTVYKISAESKLREQVPQCIR